VVNLPLQITKSQMDQVPTTIIQALEPATEIVLLNIIPTEVASQQLASLKVANKILIHPKTELI
jgi:hypothetical protein